MPLLLIFLQGCLIPESWLRAAWDVDGDGHGAVPLGGDDCDDADANAFPGAPERCGTRRDEDCDGEADEGDPEAIGVWRAWVDADRDGFGDPDRPVWVCDLVGDLALMAYDCDDQDRDVFPGAPETCNQRDDDCDVDVDDDAPPLSWYPDADGDGYGSTVHLVATCLPPAPGWVLLPDDCDDARPDVHPGADDAPYDGLDADCDGWPDDDHDRDGVPVPLDCDDDDPRRAPGRPEIAYDDVDDDCNPRNDHDLDEDGLNGPNWPVGVDCDDTQAGVGGPALWYTDADRDGFGDPATERVACLPGPLEVSAAGDCDDTRRHVNPASPEQCNGDGLDENCDGLVDIGAGPFWYHDADRDGHGADDAVGLQACDAPVPGTWSTLRDDCDDTQPTVHAASPEVCDGLDNDCDGVPDDHVGPLWYPDVDGDTWGDRGHGGTQACAAPQPGWVQRGEDCDDRRADAWPGAPELCNDRDDDCDREVDEGLLLTYFEDEDGDLVAPASPATRLACADPGAGWTLSAQLLPGYDCDDDDPGQRPGLVEICDGQDTDCDGVWEDTLLTVCGARRTWLRHGSFYFTTITAQSVWPDAQRACEAHNAHLIRPDKIAIVTGGVRSYEDADIEVYTVRAILQVARTARVFLGIRGACRLGSDYLWGDMNADGSCDAIPNYIYAPGLHPLPWSVFESSTLGAYQLPLDGTPQWTSGAANNWRKTDLTSTYDAATICEIEVWR